MKFVLNVYTKSQRAERLGIKNTPSKKQVEKLKYVHKHITEKIQSLLLFWVQSLLACDKEEFQEQCAFLKGNELTKFKSDLKKVHKFLITHGTHPFVTSGFRSKALNDATPGSSKTSQHSKAEAIDFEIIGVCNKTLWYVLRIFLRFDQLILEFHKNGKPQSGWIHVSIKKGKNRGQVLRLPRKKSKT